MCVCTLYVCVYANKTLVYVCMYVCMYVWQQDLSIRMYV